MNNRKHIVFLIKIISIFFIVLSIISILGIGIAHKVVFGRIDYDRYDSEHYLLYLDIYFLSDEALQYQSFIENETFTGKIDKNLYAQHDISFMQHLNDFLLKAV